MMKHMSKQGEVREMTIKDVHEFKGEGEEVRKERHTHMAPQETTSHMAPQETTPPLAPQEGKKRTSVITMRNKKAVRIYFEDGKQVKVEPV